ncbi:MAG TPA: DNA polymerase III subunit delta [Ktedonobacterales bacterium]|nr:DNA polymerase III subunit delta [Ktedonobacterales bacterium]
MFILLSGKDEFSAYEELARIRASGDFGYNQDAFVGETADLAVIRNTCDTMPFLAEKRLVVLEGLPRPRKGQADDGEAAEDGDAAVSGLPASPVASVAKGKRGKKAATMGLSPLAFAKGLAEYIPSLPETTVLVALVPDELKADHPLMQAARRHGKSHVFAKPTGAQLTDWVTRRARAQGRRITPESVRMLVESLGDDLRMLASEIDKLGTYVGDGGEIGVDDVRALTPVARQSKVFDLTDALARRDTSAALALLHELLANGESPLGIVALTAFQTRSLMQVKLLSDRGMPAHQIASAAGIAPFVVEKSLRLARRFTFAQLEAAHRTLLEIDTSLKRSRMTPELALDLLVLEFGKVV